MIYGCGDTWNCLRVVNACASAPDWHFCTFTCYWNEVVRHLNWIDCFEQCLHIQILIPRSMLYVHLTPKPPFTKKHLAPFLLSIFPPTPIWLWFIYIYDLAASTQRPPTLRSQRSDPISYHHHLTLKFASRSTNSSRTSSRPLPITIDWRNPSLRSRSWASNFQSQHLMI